MSTLERLVDLTTEDRSDERRPDADAPGPNGDGGGGGRRRSEPIRVEQDPDTDPPRDLDAEPVDPPRDVEIEPAPQPTGLRRPVGIRGMRIEGVRLASVAKIAAVFLTLAYVTIISTLVVVWNAALTFGFVDSLEETVTTSLGLDEQFTLVGQDLFELAVVGIGMLALLGLALTVLLALVYNVTCALLGGLAIETGPLRRRHRVFSWRHRRFITLRK